jgi:hypothetical protein
VFAEATEKINNAAKSPRSRDPYDYHLKKRCFAIIEVENRHMPIIYQARETAQSILDDGIHESNTNGQRRGRNCINPRDGRPSDRDLVPTSHMTDFQDRLPTLTAVLRSLKIIAYIQLTERAERGELEPWGEAMLAAMVDGSGRLWDRELGYKAREILERADF